MAQGEKPYRVYRGGRVKGRVPTIGSRSGRRPAATPAGAVQGPRAEGARRHRTRATGVAGSASGSQSSSCSSSSGRSAASWPSAAARRRRTSGSRSAIRRRRPRSSRQSGLVLTNPSVTLLLGTDHRRRSASAGGFERSDSIMLLRTDPVEGPPQLPVDSARPARRTCRATATTKINSAFQLGGAALAIKTVRGFTGRRGQPRCDRRLRRVHQGDRQGRRRRHQRPGPILSNKFDCPYPTQARCDRWQGWRFAKGMQHMDGHRARVYSRIRENKLNPARERHHARPTPAGRDPGAALEADEPGVLAKLPFIGDDVMKPLTTDFSAGQLIQLGAGQEAKRQRAPLPARRDARASGAGTSSPTRRRGGRLPRSSAPRRRSRRFLARPPRSGPAVSRRVRRETARRRGAMIVSLARIAVEPRVPAASGTWATEVRFDGARAVYARPGGTVLCLRRALPSPTSSSATFLTSFFSLFSPLSLLSPSRRRTSRRRATACAPPRP